MIRENQVFLQRLNLCVDGLFVFSAFLLGYFLRFHVLSGGVQGLPFQFYLLVAVGLVPLHLITYGMIGLYDTHRRSTFQQQISKMIWANTLDFIILQMFFFLFKNTHFSRLTLFLFFALLNIGLVAKQAALRKWRYQMVKKGYHQKHIILVGGGKTAQRCLKEVNSIPEFGYHVSGYVSNHQRLPDVDYLGGFDRLIEILDEQKPDEVIAGLEPDEYTEMSRVIQACEKSGTKLSIVPFFAQYMPPHSQFDSINGLPIINLRRIPLDNLGNAFIKRVVDIVGSAALIVLSSPIMLATAIGVKLSSPGPVIFRQIRVGLNKKEFSMYKFRSMRVNSESDTRWSQDSDNRKTRFGALIRKFSIDEFPQFFNVLKGDMSLVGPRPEIPHFVAQFKEEIPLYMVKHQVRPGITGWAQVNGLRGDTSIEDRIRHDIFYIENWSLLFDIKILLMTLGAGFINQEKLH